MYAQNELLYPHHVTPRLRDMRGAEWRALIDRVMSLPESHEEVLAFCLMMIRLNGCMACETDSYRAMRGCESCTAQTLRRYKGPDRDLIRVYEQALNDIHQRLLDSKPLTAAPMFAPVEEIA